MSSSHSYVGTGTTEDIYRGVINDVINGVRDYFLDENVDIEVLQQLRTTWETKVKATGAAELDGHRNKAPLPPPPIRSGANSGTSIVLNSERLRQLPAAAGQQRNKHASSTSMLVTSAQQSGRAPPASTGAAAAHSTSNIHYVQSSPSVVTAAGGNFITATIGGGQVMLPAGFRLAQIPTGGGIGSVQGGIPAAQYAVVQTGPGGQQQLIVIPSVTAAGGAHSTTLIPSHAQQVPVKVITGATGQQSSQSTSGANQQQAFVVHRPRPMAPVKRELQQSQSQQQQPASKRINQLDGKGVGMSDSSSSEDEMEEIDEEDDDPLNRFVSSHLDDPAESAEGSDINEEEPLNSGDDQSDDEDAETLFESSNIVVCQFEKVHRARNKWKFILREGIMHIDGKDYCFQKSTGEAEF